MIVMAMGDLDFAWDFAGMGFAVEFDVALQALPRQIWLQSEYAQETEIPFQTRRFLCKRENKTRNSFEVLTAYCKKEPKP